MVLFKLYLIIIKTSILMKRSIRLISFLLLLLKSASNFCKEPEIKSY